MPRRAGSTAFGPWLLGLASACSPSEPAPAAAPLGSQSGAASGAEAPREGAGASARPVAMPARAPIAGLAGLQISSRVTFFEQPEKLHTLTATFQFPERVRLRLALEQPERVDRVLYYRAGSRAFEIQEHSAVSRELEGVAVAELVLQTELRRAAFLWPDGFAWRGQGVERSTEIAGFGSLSARLGEGGRPMSISARDAGGRAVETLEEIAWKPAGERTFPSRFVLSSGEARVWIEEVTEVETVLNFVDDFFLPPDRRLSALPAPETAKR